MHHLLLVAFRSLYRSRCGHIVGLEIYYDQPGRCLDDHIDDALDDHIFTVAFGS